MKHAFIITAYCDFEMLYQQLQAYSKEFDCYVHIDKKNVVPESMIQKLSGLPNVKIISRYKINWGGVQHVYAILDLIKLAENSGIQYDYYHIMSANSILIKNVQDFKSFFVENQGKNFIELSTEEDFKEKNVLKDRYQYYYFQFLYNVRGKHSALWKKFEGYSKRIQAKIGISRKKTYQYKGYVYCSLSAVFVKYLLSYCKEHPRYLRQLKYCWVCEEFFFQNLLMESEFADTAVNDPLIFSLWEEPGRGRPAVLDMRDYEAIRASGKMFARKIGSNPSSQELFAKMLHECFD